MAAAEEQGEEGSNYYEGEEGSELWGKVLTKVMKIPLAEPFLTPVDWQAWGLHDYPQVIKKPMDLGTVLQKLKAEEYVVFDDFLADVRLVWKNCMTYNAPQSDVYKMAQKLERIFDKEVVKMKKAEMAALIGTSSTALAKNVLRPPTMEEKETFCKNMYQLGATDVGVIVTIIDHQCPAALNKNHNDEIDIDVDALDSLCFKMVDNKVRDLMTKSKSSKKRPPPASSSSTAALTTPAPVPTTTSVPDAQTSPAPATTSARTGSTKRARRE